MLAVASTRSGWIQHEGGHSSLTGNIKVGAVHCTARMDPKRLFDCTAVQSVFGDPA